MLPEINLGRVEAKQGRFKHDCFALLLEMQHKLFSTDVAIERLI